MEPGSIRYLPAGVDIKRQEPDWKSLYYEAILSISESGAAKIYTQLRETMDRHREATAVRFIVTGADLGDQC